MVGRHRHETTGMFADLFHLPAVRRQNRMTREAAAAALERVGLAAAAERPAGSLSFGDLKRLELARALASEPKLLLLDEPAAGCNAVETEGIATVIRRLSRRRHHRRAGRARHAPGHERLRSHSCACQRPHACRGHGRRGAHEPGGDRGLSRHSRRAGGGRCSRLRRSEAATAASRRCTAFRSMSRRARSSRSSAPTAPARPLLLRAISGVQPISAGRIRFEERRLDGMSAHARVALGIAQVPEGRQVFAPLSVEDNLRLGAWTRPRRAPRCRAFPRLRAVSGAGVAPPDQCRRVVGR